MISGEVPVGEKFVPVKVTDPPRLPPSISTVGVPGQAASAPPFHEVVSTLSSCNVPSQFAPQFSASSPKPKQLKYPNPVSPCTLYAQTIFADCGTIADVSTTLGPPVPRNPIMP